MISKEEVRHIAKLARLELTEMEIEKMQKDLSSILDYFNLLKKAKVSKNAQIVVGNGNATREDNVVEQSLDLALALTGAAQDKKDGYIKVKQVF